jgi:hypothetical protein
MKRNLLINISIKILFVNVVKEILKSSIKTELYKDTKN